MSPGVTGEGVTLGNILDLPFQGRAQERRHGTWRAFQRGDGARTQRRDRKGRVSVTH